MKHALITAVFVASLVASPAMAQQSENQHGRPDDAQNDRSGQHGHGAMMQDSEAMQEHRQQMQQMRELMQQARIAEDREERARLLAQHQKMMGNLMAAMMERCHQHMTMLHDMMEQMSARQEIEKHHWGSPEP
jgi:Spy/CpxP family protein refolding chaperone